jgi:hypothetical protein
LAIRAHEVFLAFNLLPRPARNWLRNWRRLRHGIERHIVPALTDGEKRQYLIDLIQRSGIRTFVETGTYRGDTVRALSKLTDRCISIELDPALYAAAREKFQVGSGIELLLGNSGDLIPNLLKDLTQPALFWLDAHYSGAGTARGAEDTPILQELGAILRHPVEGHVVVIDDARDFVGAADYPTMRSLARFVERHGYTIRARDDLITIYARPDL